MVQSNGQSLAAFRAPRTKGRYTVRVKQVADGTCQAISASSRIFVR